MEMVDLSIEVPAELLADMRPIAERAGMTVEALASLWLAEMNIAEKAYRQHWMDFTGDWP